MNFLSFLKNPLFSIQKFGRDIQKPLFINRYTKRIEQIRNEKSATVDLDKIFVDERHLVEDDVSKIKVISIKILSMIDYLAEKYDFDYCLAYGTLIGAIRHEGYIPWDDDIDIMMTKTDFEKFLEVCSELPESIHFFPQGLKFLKVMDKFSKISIDGKRGVAVDIFLLDEEPSGFSFVNVHSQKKIGLKKSDLFPTKSMPFENIQVPVPANYHKILTDIYGNYMELPPVENRVSHHVNNTSVHISNFPKALGEK